MSGKFRYGERVSIDNEFFAKAREGLDEKLQETLLQMETKAIDCAEITLKLSIALFDRTVRDEDGSYRIARVPAAHFKVTRTMKVSDSADGFCRGDSEVELLRRGDSFVLQEFDEPDEQYSILEGDAG